jgi:hypothetical protein
MNRSLERLHALLEAAWPELSHVEWEKFGDKLVRKDELGLYQWSGIVTQAVTSHVVGAHTAIYGSPLRLETSAQRMMAKLNLLVAHTHVNSSLAVRNPANNEFAGAVRATRHHNQFFALHGLPEVVDHLVATQVMHSCDLIDFAHYRSLTDPTSAHMLAARKDAGMVVKEYFELKELIAKIFNQAAKAIPIAA